jgi:hypothetical protein
MTFIWLVFLFSFVKSIVGFIIGLVSIFCGVAAAQEELPALGGILAVVGLVVVIASVGF